MEVVPRALASHGGGEGVRRNEPAGVKRWITDAAESSAEVGEWIMREVWRVCGKYVVKVRVAG